MFLSFQPISNVVGAILVVVAALMLCCVPVSMMLADGAELIFAKSALCTLIVGGSFWWYKFKSSARVNKREGYLIVVLGWFLVAVFGTLPFWFSGEFLSFTDAFFESTSGITSTGATILTDIEAISPSLLLWRSLMQWLGGMGIIVLTVALFPLLGIAGTELFVAESPGPTSDKIHPRIKDTARTLWFIYVGLTIILIIVLWLEGMSFFDAVNHSFTTTATGGFSTHTASIAFFNSPIIEYTITFFMLLGGTNYALLYYGYKMKFHRIFDNEEWRMYMIVLVLMVIVFTFVLRLNGDMDWEESIRTILFNGVSIITTTGYATFDYVSWNQGTTYLFFLLLFTGGCAGSTSGGIKLIRHLVFMRNSILEFKRILHPRALIRLKVNKILVAPRIIMHIQVFLVVYLFLFFVGALLLSIMGVDLETAIGASAACVGNIGPGIGEVGPVGSFANIPAAGKYLLSFLMICGRLELFTVLVLLSPYFWRNN